MRKLRKNNDNFLKIIVAFVLCTFSFSIGYSLLSQTLSLEATATIIPQENPPQSENLVLTYTTSNWGNTYQINFTLRNNGNVVVNNWEVIIPLPDGYSNPNGWSANYEVIGNYIHITPFEYAMILYPGNDTSFGLQFNCSGNYSVEPYIVTEEPGAYNPSTPDNPDNPDNPPDNPDNPPDNPDNPPDNPDNPPTSDHITSGLSASFNISNYWGNPGAYTIQFEVTVTNNGSTSVNDWFFDYILPQGGRVDYYYNCNYVNQDGRVRVTPVSYNSTIPPGQSVTVGFQIMSTTTEIILEVG